MKESERATATTDFKTINPTTGEIINRYQIMTKDQINDKVNKSRIAF